MLSDGSKATGFKSMVCAQFTGIGLQKDNNAFVKYNKTTGSYDDSTTISNISNDGSAKYKPAYYSYHIKASNKGVVDLTSIDVSGFAQQFLTETGGDISLTNSNSNFGQFALAADGFKKEAFQKDDQSFLTHIIPPKELPLTETSVEFELVDVAKTLSVGIATNLYLLNKKLWAFYNLKKYLYFFAISLSAIALGIYLSALVGPPPPIDRPGPSGLDRPPTIAPSRYFIHLLMVSMSCVSAVLLETFIFAKKKEQDTVLAKAELVESELKFLKMQINPHFLFNALNNIYALSVTNSEKTQESISTLSEMLRYVIYDCEQAKVPLYKELNYIENYIELFKLKSSKSFNIKLTKNIMNESILVAPMLFLPYIENAFKHSGIEKGDANFVNITLTQNGNHIEFMVENNNPETPISTDSQGGIGLPNVQKRLEILYPEKHDLKISKAEVFTVHLKLELE